MKLLAFSDLHLSGSAAAALVTASAGADLVIGAGDFCNMRRGLDRAIELLLPVSAPLVMVPGNAESAEELRAAAVPGMHVLHGEGLMIEGLRLFGLGGGIPVTPFGAWSFDLSEVAAAQALAPCTRADVLITHSPPKGLADRTGTGQSVGSTAIRAAIERIQPKLAVCGHVHDAWGMRGHIGATEVVNLGPDGHWFDIGEDSSVQSGTH